MRLADHETSRPPGPRRSASPTWCVLLLATVAGCGGSTWSGPSECEELTPGDKADDCWATTAPDLFRDDPAKGVKIVEDRVQDSRVRDYIWLAVTREVDPSSYKYCDRIEEDALEERCRVLVSRPHLHRELTGKAGKVGPGGDGPRGGQPRGGPPQGPGAGPEGPGAGPEGPGAGPEGPGAGPEGPAAGPEGPAAGEAPEASPDGSPPAPK